MHAGNIFASLISWIIAKRSGGSIVLRIEDLDPERSKDVYAQQILRDYDWLGLGWDRGPMYQSTRTEAYKAAFEGLVHAGYCYPCFCSRADIKRATSAPHFGEKRVYPGTCYHLSSEKRKEKLQQFRKAGKTPSIRFHVPSQTILMRDLFQGLYSQRLDTECGDFLIRRSDGAFAYQLAVVVDDETQGVNYVVRGVDLLSSTPQQMYLQSVLGFDHPGYAHIPLLVSRKNVRLSKRNHDAGIDALMHIYHDAAGVLGHIAYIAGIIPVDEPTSADDLLKYANLSPLYKKIQIRWK